MPDPMIPTLYKSSLAHMLAAVASGIALGLLDPHLAMQSKPLSEVFVRLIALVMNPLIFCMLASGIASMRGASRLGRTGGHALIYFVAMSLLSLLAGLLAATLLQPGAGFDAALGALAGESVPGQADGLGQAGSLHWLLKLLSLAPRVNNLYLLLAAVPVGLLLAQPGARADALLAGIDRLSCALFALVRLILTLAPLAAFSAMAFTIGKYGLVSLLPLLKFILASYLACSVFILLVIGCAARLAGLSLLRFLGYIREEMYIVFFTSSSLAALPRLTEKLQRMGCARSIVALVLPFGYSLNLAGTNLYIAMAILFLAQAAQIELGWMQLFTILVVSMMTSKGAVGIAGSGFATLAATLAVLNIVPVDMVALLLGIDRMMKCRSLTNVIGNGVACVLVAAWEQGLDREKMAVVLGGSGPGS